MLLNDHSLLKLPFPGIVVKNIYPNKAVIRENYKEFDVINSF